MRHSSFFKGILSCLLTAALFAGGVRTAQADTLTFAYKGIINVASGTTAALQTAVDPFLGESIFFNSRSMI